MQSDWIVPRIISMLLPLLFLPLAGLFFHRFDPVRTRRTSDKANRKWIGKIQSLFKPLSRRVVAILAPRARGHSFAAAIWADTILTLTLFPLVLVVFVGITIATIAGAPLNVLLPVVFAALAIIVSDIPTRDGRAGTTPILFGSPRLRERFVCWKLGSASVLCLIISLVPILRTALQGFAPLAALLVGIIFVAAIGTSLGVITANPKTFIVAFLSFWYAVVNDRGNSPILDFAGFYGTATTMTLLVYGALSLSAVAAALLAHRWRLARA